MSNAEFKEIWESAKKYVDIQLAVMEKHGSKPDLGMDRYFRLIEDVAAVVIRSRRCL